MYEPPAVKSFVILGVTRAGRPFRPSDWAYGFVVHFAADNDLQVVDET